MMPGTVPFWSDLGMSVMPQYMGTWTAIAESSTPNHETPPIAFGRYARDCDTNVVAVCCVPIALKSSNETQIT